MDSHGGWLATSSDLLHFVNAFDDPVQALARRGPQDRLDRRRERARRIAQRAAAARDAVVEGENPGH